MFVRTIIQGSRNGRCENTTILDGADRADIADTITSSVPDSQFSTDNPSPPAIDEYTHDTGLVEIGRERHMEQRLEGCGISKNHAFLSTSSATSVVPMGLL